MKSLPACFLVCSALSARAQGPVDVLTFHYDNARLGCNSQEKELTPGALKERSFGKRWQFKTDGLVWGSPLLVHRQRTRVGVADVLYAATDRNSVYAVDAKDGHKIWSRIQIAKPLSEAQFTGTWGTNGFHGILSTPVIDPVSHRLFVCGLEAVGLRQFYTVWALDLGSGATCPGYPARLRGVDRGCRFEAGQLIQRGALTLVGGRLIIPFGGRGDVPPWRGWVVSLDVRHPQNPPLTACASPHTDGGGVWSGGGVSAAANGDLFATTGNGTYDVPRGGACAAECELRLRPDRAQLGISLRDKRHTFTPANYAFLDEQDEDLGGSTINVLPDLPGPLPHLLFIGGKDGVAYLLNRDRLGGVGGEVYKSRIFSQPAAVYHEGIRSTSAYWDGGVAGRFVYVAGDEPGPDNNHGMVALRIESDTANRSPRLTRAWTLGRDFDGPSSPVISSNGTRDGIVWVVNTANGMKSSLLAFDALSGAPLYDSVQGGPKDAFDGGRRFTSPVVADGRVYVGALGIQCFGFKGGR